MDFKINREILGTNEVVYDGLQEQSVELDYILPDYYPDIFKLIKCQLSPRIISSNNCGDKVTYDMVVGIKILYCSEHNPGVQCLEQKMTFSKSVDLGKNCEKAEVSFTPKVDYCNCRVVNQRRIDLRGAITTKIKAVAEHVEEAVCDAFGMDIQLKKKQICFASKKLNTEKRITINEEFDLGFSKPSVHSIIRCDGVIMSTDKKVIANKVIIKGEAQINVLYSCDDSDGNLESMQFTLPYSQIIDMEGIDDKYDCIVENTLISCDMMPKENSDKELKILDCEMVILIKCIGLKNTYADIVTDAYSISYPCSCEMVNTRVEKVPEYLSDSIINKCTLSYNDGEIACIYDAWSKVLTASSRIDTENNCIIVMGNIACYVMIKNNDNMPMLLECEQPFEHKFKLDSIAEGSEFSCTVNTVSCSYNLVSTNSVEIKSEIKICGYYYEKSVCNIIRNIDLDESNPKHYEINCAVKMYFADPGEDIWEIAKKYSTSITAIMEENQFTDEKISERCMMLIPMLG